MAVIFGYGGDKISSSPNMGYDWNYDFARSCFLLERNQKNMLDAWYDDEASRWQNVKSRKRWPMDYQWGWWLNLGVGVVAHSQEYQSVLIASKPGDLVISKHWRSFGIARRCCNEDLLEFSKVKYYWNYFRSQFTGDLLNLK